jgi:hypothetical protein
VTKRVIRFVFATLISMLCVANATAFPVTYTEIAVIDGSLNGVDFQGKQITISGSGDTDNVMHGMPCCFRNELGANAVTLDLAGFGTGTFTDLVGVVVSQTNTGGIPGEPDTGISGAGFSDFTSGFLILWTLDPAFGTWDLKTDIGPLTGPGFCNCNPIADISFPTTLGLLHVSATDPTFTADVAVAAVPAPGTLPLFVTGLGAYVVLLGWRRKGKTSAVAQSKRVIRCGSDRRERCIHNRHSSRFAKLAGPGLLPGRPVRDPQRSCRPPTALVALVSPVSAPIGVPTAIREVP